jgi:hypothetical protein
VSRKKGWEVGNQRERPIKYGHLLQVLKSGAVRGEKSPSRQTRIHVGQEKEEASSRVTGVEHHTEVLDLVIED